MKFGGTSVGGAERMRATARIVAGRLGETPLVVTSAMSGVTNELERLASLALANAREELDAGVEVLTARHFETAAALAPGDDALVERLGALLRELRVLLRGVRLVGESSARSRDGLLGFGELLAQELLVAALAAEGVRAEAIDAREVVVTDDRHGAARPLPEAIAARAAARIAPRLAEKVVPVLGGYVGATAEGVPTTLGRGGSDLSASLLGVALGAEAVEIWTDVDGMMSADPRSVPAARRLERVTFREAAQLAAYGAKVLHPASIDPALAAGVPVFVRNSLAPERSGTEVAASGSGGAGVRAIASREAIALVTLRAPGVAGTPGFLREVVGVFVDAEQPPLAVSSAPAAVEVLVAEDGGLESALTRLSALGRVRVERGLGLVAALGEGLVDDPALWARVLALAAPFAPLRVLQAPQGSALALLARAEQLEPLLVRLHAALVEEPDGARGETGAEVSPGG